MIEPQEFDRVQPPAVIAPIEVEAGAEAPQAPDNLSTLEPDSWIRRHKVGLGIAGIAVAGALSATQFHKTMSDIEHDVKWAVPAIAVTETAAWGGAGMMLLSAGSKIGNPLTVKKRLTQIAAELEDNQLFRKGWAVNVGGAAGTATVIAAGAVTSLPINSWPLAAGAAGASLAFSGLPLKGMVKKNSRSPERSLK